MRPFAVFTAALLLVLTACGGESEAPEAEASESPTESPSETATPAPNLPADYSILDGWVNFTQPVGWSIDFEAERLQPIRSESSDYTPAYADLETLLVLSADDDTATVTLAREPAFSFALDVDAWLEALVTEASGPDYPVLADDPIQLPHGPARRIVLGGTEGTIVLAATAYGTQRLLLRVDSPLEPADAAAAANEVLGGVTLTPDLVLAPLLHRRAVGTRYLDQVEVTLDIPAHWTTKEEGDFVRYQAQRGTGEVTLFFTQPGDQRTPAELLDGVLAGGGRDPVAGRDVRTFGEVDFEVARFGRDIPENQDLGTGWLLVGKVGDVAIAIDLVAGDPQADQPLLREILDTIQVTPVA